MIDQKQIRSGLTFVFIASLLAVVIVPLPRLGGSLAGHALGIIGTVIMLLTLVYPFRKRVLGRKGKKNPIATHTLWGLLGPSLVVFHTGGEFKSLIGNLVFICMVIVVLSGIIGIYLFKRAKKTLKEHEQDLSQLKKIFFEKKRDFPATDLEIYGQGDEAMERSETGSIDETVDPSTVRRRQDLEQIVELIADKEHTIKVYATIERIFARWSKAHIALVFFLLAFLGSHIAVMIYYGLRWL
ncbi:MAG: hypothetical protein ACQERT_12935 [Thermodesulfobacteriota bacterium]